MTPTRNGVHTIEHDIGEQGELILRLPTGLLEIRAGSGSTAIVRDLDGHDLEERFEIERAPGRLALRPRDRLMLDLGFMRRGRAGGRIDVELPAGATLSIDTASADVRSEGLTGEQRYRTASGDIDLTSVSGPIAVETVSGSATIDAAGAVELSGRLVSGDLRLSGGWLRSLALGTTSGDVSLLSPMEGPGPYSVQTVSGDVEVVGGGRGLRVDAKTLTGDITTDLPSVAESGRGRRSMVIGAGDITLTFKSISGDLRVSSRARGSGGVVSHASPEPPAPPAPPEPPLAPEPFGATAPDPAAPEPDAPDSAAPVASAPDPRLEILRDLEAGTINVETATRRLAALEDGDDA